MDEIIHFLPVNAVCSVVQIETREDDDFSYCM